MKGLARSLLAAALVLISFSAVERANAAQHSDSAFHYTFIYPDTWHTRTWPTHPGMVVLRNFPDGQYLHGGNVPFGGAEIFVSVVPPFTPDWPQGTDEYVHLHGLAARTGTILSETTRPGAPARVKWTRDTASGTTNTSIWTAVRFAGRVFSISMDFQAADPAGAQYEQVLADLVASLTTATSTPSPSGPPTP